MTIRPKTTAEILALPVGPDIGVKTYRYTAEDKSRGYAIVRGKRFDITVGCNSLMVPVMPDVIADYVSEDDSLGAVDGHGVAWSVGKYADGSYFKRRL
jgi:hypothetical protein